MRNLKKISCKPLTVDQWHHFQKLFGEKGACGGCWCMYWRLKRSDFLSSKGIGNKRLFRQVVQRAEIPPGLLLFSASEPVGWCAVSPRSSYPVLSNSRILKPLDDQSVWSIVCFFIHKDFRRLGLTVVFLKHILQFCKSKKALIVEGYPVDVSGNEKYPAVFAFTGVAAAFIKAGFKQAALRSPRRPIMRYDLRDGLPA
jgi:GNAT superfamily N-acetyltransferase